MNKKTTSIIVIFSVTILVLCCFLLVKNGTFEGLYKEKTVEGKYDIEYGKDIFPNNADEFLIKKNNKYLLIAGKGIQEIDDLPITDMVMPKKFFYDQNMICGLYINKNDESIIYIYDIKTKSYREVLKEFKYNPKRQFTNISYFKNNKIIAYGEYDNSFTIFDLNDHSTKCIVVKADERNLVIGHTEICEQGYFTYCTYNDGGKSVVEHLFIDKNGSIINRCKIPNVQGLGSTYMELSPHSSMLLYSIGKTGDNRYIYDFSTEKVYEIYNSNALVTHWSSNDEYFYTINYIEKEDNKGKCRVEKKNVNDIIMNK